MRTAIAAIFCSLGILIVLSASDSVDRSVTTSEVSAPVKVTVPDITVDLARRATVKQILHLFDRSTGKPIGMDWLVVGIYHNDDLSEALKVNKAVVATITAELDFAADGSEDALIQAYKKAGFTRVDIYARDAVPTADPAFEEVDPAVEL